MHHLPLLIMVMGLPGSGKSYFAKAFSERIGGIHVNSDMVRKKPFSQPAYTPTGKAAVYETMFNRIRRIVKKGETAIVDATFSLQKYRAPYFDFAQVNDILIPIIQIEAGEQTIAQRLKKKRPDSDADISVYKKIKSEFEPLNRDHLVLNSDKLSLEEMIEQGLKFIGTKKKTDD